MKIVAWDDYAETYDLMARWNPAYQDLLARFEGFAKSWCLGPDAQVLEVGSGTGNFSLAAAALYPKAQVILSEPEEAMRKRAQAKARDQGLSNVTFLPEAAEALALPDGCLSGAILVHVLYALPEPKVLLRRLYGWLKPGAHLFACDFGRQMNVADWRKYLVTEMMQSHGLRRTLLALWQGRGIARANRAVARAQMAGEYWMHTNAAFAEAFEEAGFRVLRSELAYRGYSDLVLCRK